MIIDNLTLAGVGISLIASAIAIYVTIKSRNDNKKELRAVIKHTSMIQQDDEALKLCKAIRALDPSACPGIDYLLNTDASGKTQIVSWKSKKPMPSKQELAEKLKQLTESINT